MSLGKENCNEHTGAVNSTLYGGVTFLFSLLHIGLLGELFDLKDMYTLLSGMFEGWLVAA